MKRTLCKRCLALPLALAMLFVPVDAAYTPMRDKCVFRRHDNAYRKIALTFDDGPHPTYTAEILDILADFGVHATFFVIGENAAAHPDLLMREAAEGHEIGNHTASHCRMAAATRAELASEILSCEETVEQITDERPDLFRPPEGKCSEMISELATSLDYRIVLWCIDTLDWKHPSPERIYDEVISKVRPGDIILFHDFVGGESQTVKALSMILPELLAQGFVPVTVSELLDSN